MNQKINLKNIAQLERNKTSPHIHRTNSNKGFLYKRITIK